VARALEQIFEEPVIEVRVIEYSRYARVHRGMAATTRPDRILLAASGAEFIANPGMVLHEYFHVLRQWRTGYLTRWRYLFESARCGYWENCFEREAREFSSSVLRRYLGCLRVENERGRGNGTGARRCRRITLRDGGAI
jgi:hypothetical protein